MTVVMSIPSQQYTPRTIEQQRNIPASVKRLRFTMTREGWPAGPIGGLSVTMPDGSPGGGATFDGGPLFTDAGGKRLSTVAVPGVIDIPVAVADFEFSWYNPQTGILDLPAGQYTFTANILQTITTAFTVERF